MERSKDEIRARYENVMERIARAAERAGRSVEDIKIVGVTKGVDIESIRYGIDLGLKAIGENRVQEAREKHGLLERDAEWHLIGHLQSNKINHAIRIFDLIESVDTLELAREIDVRSRRIGRVMPILVQVNVASDEKKFGISAEELSDMLKGIDKLEGVKVEGLMTIAPYAEDPEDVRWCFAKLRELAQEMKKGGFERVDMRFLSMGMSGDFEVAVEEGANIVRIGSAIFGERIYQAVKK